MFKDHTMQVRMVKDPLGPKPITNPTWTAQTINETIERQGKNLVKAIVIILAAKMVLDTTEQVITKNTTKDKRR